MNKIFALIKKKIQKGRKDDYKQYGITQIVIKTACNKDKTNGPFEKYFK